MLNFRRQWSTSWSGHRIIVRRQRKLLFRVEQELRVDDFAIDRQDAWLRLDTELKGAIAGPRDASKRLRTLRARVYRDEGDGGFCCSLSVDDETVECQPEASD